MARRTKPAEKPETVTRPQLSDEDIAATANLQVIQMPEWYASGAQLVIAGNDAILIFNKPVLLGSPTNGAQSLSHNVALVAPVGQVRMSMGTLKDISVLLSEQVAKREQETGVIETTYTKERAAASK